MAGLFWFSFQAMRGEHTLHILEHVFRQIIRSLDILYPGDPTVKFPWVRSLTLQKTACEQQVQHGSALISRAKENPRLRVSWLYSSIELTSHFRVCMRGLRFEKPCEHCCTLRKSLPFIQVLAVDVSIAFLSNSFPCWPHRPPATESVLVYRDTFVMLHYMGFFYKSGVCTSISWTHPCSFQSTGIQLRWAAFRRGHPGVRLRGLLPTQTTGVRESGVHCWSTTLQCLKGFSRVERTGVRECLVRTG